MYLSHSHSCRDHPVSDAPETDPNVQVCPQACPDSVASCTTGRLREADANMATYSSYGAGMLGERRTGFGPSPQPRGRGEEAGRPARLFGGINEEKLATGLGWFSLGLGAAALIAPERLAKLIGVKERTALIRGVGAREIASGVGILSQRRPAGWLWSRVGGDLMDLSMLGAAIKSRRRNRGRTIAATAGVVTVAALDLFASRRLTLSPETGYRAIRVRKAITIDRSPEDVYYFWRDLHNLPRFIRHFESVEVTGDRRMRIKAKVPMGRAIEWDAEITDDVVGERIAWRSVEGSGPRNSGSVRFERAPGGRGAIVRLEVELSPPGGALAVKLAELFGVEPGERIDSALRALKQIMETGDVVKSDASIHRGMHAAQPPAVEQAARPGHYRAEY